MDNKKFNSYVNKVLRYINTNAKTKKKIKEDLLISLESRSRELYEKDPYKIMGHPKDVAYEFMDNMDIRYYGWQFHEYKSETTIMGIPLIHIINNQYKVAKGIIAVGPIAIGVISLGALSFGILSFGAISVGLLISLGGFSSSLGTAIGGVAFAYDIALGGLAYAKNLAFGGIASADIAIGGNIKALVGAYNNKGIGNYVYNIYSEKEKVLSAIQNIFPDLSKFKLSLINKLLNLI